MGVVYFEDGVQNTGLTEVPTLELTKQFFLSATGGLPGHIYDLEMICSGFQNILKALRYKFHVPTKFAETCGVWGAGGVNRKRHWSCPITGYLSL